MLGEAACATIAQGDREGRAEGDGVDRRGEIAEGGDDGAVLVRAERVGEDDVEAASDEDTGHGDGALQGERDRLGQRQGRDEVAQRVHLHMRGARQEGEQGAGGRGLAAVDRAVEEEDHGALPHPVGARP